MKVKVESEETCERLKNNLSAQVLSYEAVKAENSSLVETLNAYEEYTKGMLKNFRLILTEHQEVRYILKCLVKYLSFANHSIFL